jgi:hypothetical protein
MPKPPHSSLTDQTPLLPLAVPRGGGPTLSVAAADSPGTLGSLPAGHEQHGGQS